MSIRACAAGAIMVLILSGCSDAVPGQPLAGSSRAEPAQVAGGEYVAIPRTNVMLRVPGGMEVDPSLPGLAKPNSRTTVVVVTMPVQGKTPRQVLDEMAGGFKGPQAQQQGMELGELQDRTVAGFPAKAATGTQRIPAGTFAKVLVVVAADDGVVLMNGSVEPGDRLSATDLLGVLTDARWSSQAASGDLGFDLTPAKDYERKPGGNSGILFRFTGDSATGAPTLVAAPSLGQSSIPADDRRAFAVARFRQLPPKPSVQATTAVQAAGLPGFEVTGRGTRRGEMVYAAVLFTQTGYIVITGDYSPTDYSDQLPAFRAMTQSLVLT